MPRFPRPEFEETKYLTLLRRVRTFGARRPSRAKLKDGTQPDTLGLFGHQLRFDLREGFPLLTTKYVPFGAVAHELLWFLKGSTNVAYLREHGVTIWDEWASPDGELGPVYGHSWRNWGGAISWAASPKPRQPGIDQIANVIDGLKRDPYGRRHIVSACNPASRRYVSIALRCANASIGIGVLLLITSKLPSLRSSERR